MLHFIPKMDELYREYAALQLRRHYLLLEGKDETDETEQVETRLSSLWEKLDEEQRWSLNGMGSDLNWVRRRGEPPPKGPKPADVTKKNREDLEAAQAADDWHAILHFLRVCSPLIFPESVAYTRATCYREIGLDPVAVVFCDFTASISRGTGFAMESMRVLMRLDPDKGLQRAVSIIESPSLHPPLVVALSASVVLESMRRHGESISAEPFVVLLEKTTKRLLREPHSPYSLTMFARYAGSILQALGDSDRALHLYEEGLKLAPHDKFLLAGAGAILFEKDRDRAAEYLRRASQQKTRQVLPYFLLTLYHMERSEFSQALSLAQQAWECRIPDLGRVQLRAQLLCYIAICQSELEYPNESVLGLFKRAIEIDPSNQTIATNFRLFEERSKGRADLSWQLDLKAELGTEQSLTPSDTEEMVPAR
jgi:tetratricopeptide (TPR) repeat protein